jgi:hypothetical protein
MYHQQRSGICMAVRVHTNQGEVMKKVSSVRITVCSLVLLSFAGACLSQPAASAQDGVRQESQVRDQDGKTLERKAKKRKARPDKSKANPMICNNCEIEDPEDPPDTGSGGSSGDGHMWCDGWDRQGSCAFNHLGVAGGAEFKRLRGNNGYDWQTFLTWHPGEFDGFGRFPVHDGNVGVISTSPLEGQVPLHRWSTRKGFKYSIYFAEYGGDYVYGGIAGYVWPAGDRRGFPLYQFYSHEYGHFYTNFPRNEISCQPRVFWDFQGEMARVNWPAPFSQANRICTTLGPFPPSCDPFFAERCRQQGWVFRFQDCSCSPF